MKREDTFLLNSSGFVCFLCKSLEWASRAWLLSRENSDCRSFSHLDTYPFLLLRSFKVPNLWFLVYLFCNLDITRLNSSLINYISSLLLNSKWTFQRYCLLFPSYTQCISNSLVLLLFQTHTRAYKCPLFNVLLSGKGFSWAL